ncbi:MAG: DMT family transporter [Rubrivivax sp.]|nr:DMT family transporter [Rubrivivax sp.]
MSGVLWAVAAGVGFGVFQTLNRRAVQGMDVYVATFLQLLISALVLAAASLITEDLALLRQVSIWAWINFSLAGFFHFFIGWTLLNASQKKIGAARTGSLIGTTPLFGAVVAALTLAEFPTLITIVGILLIVGGVYLVNYANIKRTAPARNISGGAIATGWRSLLLGLAAAICWSISPLFIRHGLAELPSPILGVTIGITACVLGYALVLVLRGSKTPLTSFSTDAFTFKLVAAMLVGLSTWARWVALDLSSVALVLALSLVSVPVVNVLSPLLVGHHVEQVTGQVWLGSALIVGGSLILIFLR